MADAPSLVLEVGCASHPGAQRSENEDSTGAHVPEDAALLERKGALFALADGLGGHLAGEVASSLAVSALVAEYYSPSNHARIEPALRQAVQTANLRVFDAAQRRAEHRGMATTLTAVALAGRHAFLAHVGDSRAYHLQDGRLRQLTTDHSEVAELVRMRVLSAERARNHPNRNVLTRSLGSQLLLRPDFHRQPVQPGDELLLCTDGLWSELEDTEMEAILTSHAPQAACQQLIERALDRDCADNVTAQVIRIVAVPPDVEGASGPRAGWLSGIFQRGGRL